MPYDESTPPNEPQEDRPASEWGREAPGPHAEVPGFPDGTFGHKDPETSNDEAVKPESEPAAEVGSEVLEHAGTEEPNSSESAQAIAEAYEKAIQEAEKFEVEPPGDDARSNYDYRNQQTARLNDLMKQHFEGLSIDQVALDNLRVNAERIYDLKRYGEQGKNVIAPHDPFGDLEKSEEGWRARAEGREPEPSGPEGRAAEEVYGENPGHARVEDPESSKAVGDSPEDDREDEQSAESESKSVEHLEEELEEMRDKWKDAIDMLEGLTDTSAQTAWLVRIYRETYPGNQDKAQEVRGLVSDLIMHLTNKYSNEVKHAVSEIQRLEKELEKARQQEPKNEQKGSETYV